MDVALPPRRLRGSLDLARFEIGVHAKTGEREGIDRL
jgi:hypothetical protein